MREYIPSGQIFVVAPFGGFCAPSLQSATTQYRNTHPNDTRVAFLNLGPTAQKGVMAQVPSGTAQSYDGIHPDVATHRALGFQLAAAMQTALGRNDLNGDGKPDIVFQNQTTHQIAVWFMDGARVIGGKLLGLVPGAGYRVVGTGDFNRDGQTDLLFQDDASGTLVLWYMNGTSYAGGSVVSAVPQAGYHVESVADFDGDGRPDVALRNANGNIALWHLDGGSVFFTESLSLRLDPAFRIAGPR